MLAEQPIADWRAADRDVAVDAKPQLFGLASVVIDELFAEPSALAHDAAAYWSAHIASLRTRAYALADDEHADERFEERMDVRVQTGEALTALTRALLVARAGRSLLRADTAQLHLRSAHFLLVQAQTDAVRAAQLQRLARD